MDERVGQLFMAGIPGRKIDPGTEMLIRDHGLGGVILFDRNIESPIQLTELCLALQELAMKYQGKPLFLAVDQEGGRVARLREPFTIFPGNTAIGMDNEPLDRAVEFASITAKEMSMVGLNMDLAPVMDVRRGTPEKHLDGRTFGDDPEKVSSLGTAVIKGLQENGILAVAKHFPGLGKAQLDPHVHLPVIDSDYEEILKINLPPFTAAINAGVSAIMTSHAIYPSIEAGIPATLSKKVLNGILRDTLRFDGLIITDDLEMGAIEKKWGAAEGASISFESGADILLICEDQEKVLDGMEILKNKLINTRISIERLQLSEKRIAEAKTRFMSGLKEASVEKVRDYFGL
jgi:beta-N-acetylhexosaminidase